MLYWQYVDPEVIFQFNARFTERWDEAGLTEIPPATGKGKTESVDRLEKAFVIPLHFRKATQTFQWVGISSPMWDWDRDEPCGEGDDSRPLDHYQALLAALRPHFEKFQREAAASADEARKEPESAWGRFRKNLKDTGLSSYRHAIEVIEDFLQRPGAPALSAKEVRAMLVAYSAYHHGAGSKKRGDVERAPWW